MLVRRVRGNTYTSLVPGGLTKDIIGLWSSRARSPENDRRVVGSLARVQ